MTIKAIMIKKKIDINTPNTGIRVSEVQVWSLDKEVEVGVVCVISVGVVGVASVGVVSVGVVSLASVSVIGMAAVGVVGIASVGVVGAASVEEQDGLAPLQAPSL